jgi:hypothetical protein
MQKFVEKLSTPLMEQLVIRRKNVQDLHQTVQLMYFWVQVMFADLVLDFVT